MTREWPDTLDELLAEPVIRHCPERCPFHELCPTVRQVGIADLFRRGRYTEPRDCLWWERLAGLLYAELGASPPETAADLRELLGQVIERRAIQEET